MLEIERLMALFIIMGKAPSAFMIDKFFIQTNKTILNFLSEIGKNKKVFSTYSCMEMDGYKFFFYAIPTEIVLVCMNAVDEGSVKYADRGFMELYQHAKKMRRFLALSCQYSFVPAIHLAYLTNARSVKYPKVVRSWKQNLFGFSVLQNMSGLRDLEYSDIPVNRDLELEGSEYWTKWQTFLRNRGHFDWANDMWADWPLPSDKRYGWRGEMGHLISDEFKVENGE